MAHYHRNLFEETAVSWPRMKRGLRLQLEQHPKSQVLAQEFAFNASLAGDVHAAHEMFRRTGPRCDIEVWRSKRMFTGFYVWVQAQDAQVRTASVQ